ncbi:DeoR/GlpR family DNA-binding transcription regulator [Metabacillus sp. Hm71]|uniref:DeoR/GlpR family DNA-binding transcription regulator n=1 Tax=Metabacillus sp. Hm71 TaxID=3450743 RepID=UPI003F42694F
MRNNKIAIERQKEIYSLIVQAGTVRVTNLSKRFKVTAETIRRDLEQMEKDGLVQRIHGGAYINQQENKETTLLFKQDHSNQESKQAIAQEAAKLVKTGAIIALDSSDISYELAKKLVDIDITVITNSIPVTLEFLNRNDNKVKVITVGGYLNKEMSSFIGTVTEKSIEVYNVDMFFFSCSGFHLEYGVYENNEMEAQVKYKFTTISEESILLADHTKFGQKSLTSFIGIDKIHKLIMDQGVAIHNLTALKNKGVHVEIAK